MASNIKIIPTMFLVYEYDKEEEYMNSMSLKGWQLKKGGLFHHTYERKEQCYRYKLDYNNKVNLNAEERSRYLSIFNEQGWEFVNSTVNGWHYFRKKYDPSFAEDEYEIYTDDTSLMDMLNRWVKIARILQAFYLVLLLCNLALFIFQDSQVALIESVIVGLGIVIFEFCIRNLKSKRAGAKPDPAKRDFGGYLLVGWFISSMLLLFYFASFDPYIYETKSHYTISQYTPELINTMIKVKKDGQYLVDMKCKTERGNLSVCILSKNKLVYKETGANFKVTNSKLRLKKGVYTLKATYYQENDKEVFHTEQKKLEQNLLSGEQDKKSKIEIDITMKRSLF